MLKKGVQIVILLCGLVVLCNLFCKKEQDTKGDVCKQLTSTAGFVVQVQEEKGSFFYDPEELLPRMVLAVLPVTQEELFETELLKAMFILCRTNLWNYWEEQEKKDVIYLGVEESFLPILSEAAYRKMMEQPIPKNHKNDILNAQKATKGIILSFQGEVIEAPFFYLSMGRTRSAKELFTDGRFSYLRARDCSTDMLHQDYLQQSVWEQDAFYEKLLTLFMGERQAKEMLQTQELAWSDFQLEETESGYLKTITYLPEQIRLDGNTFQEAFMLASGCITIEEREHNMVLQTKGVGHGFGFSICYGATLAQQEKSYEELLFYFFEQINLERKYNVLYEE